MMNDATPDVVLHRYLHQVKNPSHPLTLPAIKHYSQQAVSFFLEHAATSGTTCAAAIELLCEINSLPNPTLSRIGLEALFPNLIEALNDSFDPIYCQLYDRLFAQVIAFSRRLTEGAALDNALAQFGLRTEDAILTRKAALTPPVGCLSSNRPVHKILLFSRITIGADVALTSVFISHLKQFYPSAEIVIIGPQKLNDLYGGDSRIRIKPISYGRTSSLQARLNNWLELLELVQEEIASLPPANFLVVDTDSRLTQLGLLPALSPELEPGNYFYFPSRTYSHPHFEKLGELASHWISSLTATNHSSFPFLSLPPKLDAQGASLIRLLVLTSPKPVVCLSFGFGGNSRKRISETFELAVAEKLSLSNRLILDCGGTAEEFAQAQQILNYLQGKGKTILPLSESDSIRFANNSLASSDVISWQGGIGSIASLITHSQRYIGYDSSGQHIAAASSTPTLTLFVNSGSPTFAKRWRPHGRTETRILPIETSSLPLNPTQFSELLGQI